MLQDAAISEIHKIIKRKKTYMIWTRGKGGRKKTPKCSTAWACERRKKQMKTKEELAVREDLEKKTHTIIYSICRNQE